MNTAFYVAAAIAVFSTVQAITQLHAVRALLYLIVSLLSVSIIFYILGAPFVAALEVITYAGAIMVLFIFVIMMLNLGPVSVNQERQWLNPKMWIGPSVLAVILLGEFIFTLFWALPKQTEQSISVVGPKVVGAALLGPYALGVELASMLLLAGLVGAYHLGYRTVALTGASREKEAPNQPSPIRVLVPPQLKLVSSQDPEKQAGAS
jgi:NADH-quinone oxidoreductase subunit J